MEGRRSEIYNRIVSNITTKGTCWEWNGATSGKNKGCRKTRGGGYPRMALDGATMAVHRVMWSIINGPIAHKNK